ncbi:hypothetical protein AD936_01380, partial [Gluconobacter japonicus]
RACEVAAEQRFEHQDQRISLAAREVLLDNVPPDSDSLHQRNGHYNPLVLASGKMRHDSTPEALLI